MDNLLKFAIGIWNLVVIFKDLPEAECDEDEDDEQDCNPAVELHASPGKQCLHFIASFYAVIYLCMPTCWD